MNHEQIHAKQQKELLVLPFFIWYVMEYLIRLLIYRNSFKAYVAISFEREAYENEKDLHYLKTRRFWGFLKYI